MKFIPQEAAVSKIVVKGQRVEVRHQSGTEFGTVLSVRDRGYGMVQVDVHLDDRTYCWFPISQVRPIVAA